MWIILIGVLLIAGSVGIGIAENKRRQKAKVRAEERRERRRAMLEEQKQKQHKAFANDTEEGIMTKEEKPAKPEKAQAPPEDEEAAPEEGEQVAAARLDDAKKQVQKQVSEEQLEADLAEEKEVESCEQYEEALVEDDTMPEMEDEDAAPEEVETVEEEDWEADEWQDEAPDENDSEEDEEAEDAEDAERDVVKEAARAREESALDVLTSHYSYIEEDEEQEKKEKRAAVLWGIGLILIVLAVIGLIYLWLFTPESGEEAKTENSYQAEYIEGKGYQTFSEKPHAVEATNPQVYGIDWSILTAEGETKRYQREMPIRFGMGDAYFQLPGIATFRGNCLRDNASSYGNAVLNQHAFGKTVWEQTSSALPTADGSDAWTGSGWTGQPLIAQWDSETRRNMNLYEEKKNKENLIEVIYATLDGTIYFMDLEDGAYTRDPLYLGMAFKGSGALDPRGYPLMYVGSGDFTMEEERPHMYIISLIDGSVLYEYGAADPASLRDWCGFDSSPLVHAESDTLIWPGENGILYTMKLGTVYDKKAGTISVQPELTARTVYQTSRSNEVDYWLGYECSASIIDHYIYLSENGGMFYCVDLNTMELIWAQDTKDDSNSSPVAEFDPQTGRGYIYTAPSLHWTANEEDAGPISLYKLDAITGEIVWEKSYDCFTVEGVSGGVQATPLLGEAGSDIENLVIYPVARTPNPWEGVLVALDKNSGNVVWELPMDNFAWSSPVGVYTVEGKSYIVQFDSQGYGFLIEGTTGKVVSEMEVGSPVEATPVVYGNRMVLGTRGQRMMGVDLQ